MAQDTNSSNWAAVPVLFWPPHLMWLRVPCPEHQRQPMHEQRGGRRLEGEQSCLETQCIHAAAHPVRGGRRVICHPGRTAHALTNLPHVPPTCAVSALMCVSMLSSTCVDRPKSATAGIYAGRHVSACTIAP